MSMVADSLAMVVAAAADPVGSMLLSNGSLGVILFVVWKLGNKLVDKLISPVTDYIKRQDEATQIFKDSHEHFHTEISKIFGKLDEIDSHCHRLMEGTDGNITHSQAINIVSVYVAKVMSETLIWWQERVAINGIHSDKEKVQRRYSERVELLKGKFISEMGMWRVGGVSLDNWCETGISDFLHDTYKKLFDVQLAMMESRPSDIIGTEIPVWLSHRVSQMMGAISDYVKNGTTLDTYLKKNPLTGDTIDFLK